ncbi:hypothetical protein DPEC_G00283680 [Dallia pectoralis]|uniref:Uncharacterized protein n=1 Tax=Dallia pectoralis TaxID=75939 RepID=A0ACC2FJB5_DALPE|nr:hypothetical protein DPEC_G00283680 [Dallia pectoralis]
MLFKRTQTGMSRHASVCTRRKPSCETVSAHDICMLDGIFRSIVQIVICVSALCPRTRTPDGGDRRPAMLRQPAGGTQRYNINTQTCYVNIQLTSLQSARRIPRWEIDILISHSDVCVAVVCPLQRTVGGCSGLVIGSHLFRCPGTALCGACRPTRPRSPGGTMG